MNYFFGVLLLCFVVAATSSRRDSVPHPRSLFDSSSIKSSSEEPSYVIDTADSVEQLQPSSTCGACRFLSELAEISIASRQFLPEVSESFRETCRTFGFLNEVCSQISAREFYSLALQSQGSAIDACQTHNFCSHEEVKHLKSSRNATFELLYSQLSSSNSVDTSSAGLPEDTNVVKASADCFACRYYVWMCDYVLGWHEESPSQMAHFTRHVLSSIPLMSNSVQHLDAATSDDAFFFKMQTGVPTEVCFVMGQCPRVFVVSNHEWSPTAVASYNKRWVSPSTKELFQVASFGSFSECDQVPDYSTISFALSRATEGTHIVVCGQTPYSVATSGEYAEMVVIKKKVKLIGVRTPSIVEGAQLLEEKLVEMEDPYWGEDDTQDKDSDEAEDSKDSAALDAFKAQHAPKGNFKIMNKNKNKKNKKAKAKKQIKIPNGSGMFVYGDFTDGSISGFTFGPKTGLYLKKAQNAHIQANKFTPESKGIRISESSDSSISNSDISSVMILSKSSKIQATSNAFTTTASAKDCGILIKDATQETLIRQNVFKAKCNVVVSDNGPRNRVFENSFYKNSLLLMHGAVDVTLEKNNLKPESYLELHKSARISITGNDIGKHAHVVVNNSTGSTFHLNKFSVNALLDIAASSGVGIRGNSFKTTAWINVTSSSHLSVTGNQFDEQSDVYFLHARDSEFSRNQLKKDGLIIIQHSPSFIFSSNVLETLSHVGVEESSSSTLSGNTVDGTVTIKSCNYTSFVKNTLKDNALLTTNNLNHAILDDNSFGFKNTVFLDNIDTSSFSQNVFHGDAIIDSLTSNYLTVDKNDFDDTPELLLMKSINAKVRSNSFGQSTNHTFINAANALATGNTFLDNSFIDVIAKSKKTPVTEAVVKSNSFAKKGAIYVEQAAKVDVSNNTFVSHGLVLAKKVSNLTVTGNVFDFEADGILLRSVSTAHVTFNKLNLAKQFVAKQGKKGKGKGKGKGKIAQAAKLWHIFDPEAPKRPHKIIGDSTTSTKGKSQSQSPSEQSPQDTVTVQPEEVPQINAAEQVQQLAEDRHLVDYEEHSDLSKRLRALKPDDKLSAIYVSAHSSNLLISGNQVSGSVDRTGLTMRHVSQIQVTENVFASVKDAIFLTQLDGHVNVTHNHVQDSSRLGVFVHRSNNFTTLRNNYIGAQDVAFVAVDSGQLLLNENDIQSNRYGVVASDCHAIELDANKVSASYVGVQLDQSSDLAEVVKADKQESGDNVDTASPSFLLRHNDIEVGHVRGVVLECGPECAHGSGGTGYVYNNKIVLTNAQGLESVGLSLYDLHSSVLSDNTVMVSGDSGLLLGIVDQNTDGSQWLSNLVQVQNTSTYYTEMTSDLYFTHFPRASLLNSEQNAQKWINSKRSQQFHSTLTGLSDEFATKKSKTFGFATGYSADLLFSGGQVQSSGIGIKSFETSADNSVQIYESKINAGTVGVEIIGLGHIVMSGSVITAEEGGLIIKKDKHSKDDPHAFIRVVNNHISSPGIVARVINGNQGTRVSMNKLSCLTSAVQPLPVIAKSKLVKKKLGKKSKARAYQLQNTGIVVQNSESVNVANNDVDDCDIGARITKSDRTTFGPLNDVSSCEDIAVLVSKKSTNTIIFGNELGCGVVDQGSHTEADQENVNVRHRLLKSKLLVKTSQLKQNMPWLQSK